MAEVLLEHVSKHFGNIVAVNDISLEIEDKEFLTLVGPSGCGKSTTLRMIAGLEKLTTGQIYIGGSAVGNLPPNKRDIAMVFQSYALYPHLDIRQNIGFALKMMRMQKQELNERVERVAEMLDIGQLLNRKPKELSGGQRQRVALGRALVRDSGAYLLDEPLSNLDAKLRVHMRAELRKLHDDLQHTFIYVTHDQAEAMTMSDRIAIMDAGEIQQCASPLEIYDQPANLFVAEFMGSPAMNVLSGELKREDGTLYFVSNGVRQPLRDELVAAVSSKDCSEVILGIRPEDIQLTDETGNKIHAVTVFVEEVLGSENLVTVDVGTNKFKVRTPPEYRTHSRQSLGMRFTPEKIHLFDTETGEALRSA